MSTVQRVAQIIGWVFIIIAVLGLLDTGFRMEAHLQRADRLLGIFPINFLHNLVHLAFGIWGVWAASTWAHAKSYCQIAGVAYLGLALLAFFIPTVFGLIPIGGNNIWLHILLGVVLAYFGFTAREAPAERAGV